MRILVKMVDSSSVERRRSANDTVDLVALGNDPQPRDSYLGKQELCEIGAILTRDTRNQGDLLLGSGTLSAIRHTILTKYKLEKMTVSTMKRLRDDR